MNSQISLDVINNILNAPHNKYLKKEYINIILSYVPSFKNGEDDGSFHNIVLYDSYYQLNTFKTAGKRTKLSNKKRNECIIYILRNYIYYLYKTNKPEADTIREYFELTTGLKYVENVIIEEESILKEECIVQNVVKEVKAETPNIFLLFNFVFLFVAFACHLFNIFSMVY